MAPKENSKARDAIAALTAAKNAARSLVDAELEIRNRIASLRKERQTVSTALASKAEILANLDTLVDTAAQRWAQDRASKIARDLGGGTEFVGTNERPRAATLPHWGDLAGTLNQADLAGLFPTVYKARLREIIERAGLEFGFPAAERAARLAELDAEIQSATEAHEGLLRESAALGVRLPGIDALERADQAPAPGGSWEVRGAISIPAAQ